MASGPQSSGRRPVLSRGLRVRLLRERVGLSQRRLAAEAGFHEKTVQNIEEKPDYEPSVHILEALASALERRGISRSEFFGEFFLLQGTDAAVGPKPELLGARMTQVEDLDLGRALFRVLPLKTEHWETHLARARIAEGLLSSVPVEAFRAAWHVADALIQLGRYRSAEAEIDRILGQYAADIDIEVTVGLYYQRARLRFSDADPRGAERWYRDAVGLLDAAGHTWNNLANHPVHFLARHLGGAGKWQEAEVDYATALDHHLRSQAFHLATFDVLWRAQMRIRRAEMLGESYDSTADFDRAEQLSGHIQGYRHLQLERARVRLRDGEFVDPRDVLESWLAEGYARGVARYFDLRKESFRRLGKTNDAIEAAVAALLTLPADRNLTRSVWEDLFELRDELGLPVTDLELLRDRAHARRGLFHDVDAIARDHLDESVEQIVERLRRPGSSLKMPVRTEEEREPQSSSTDDRGDDKKQ